MNEFEFFSGCRCLFWSNKCTFIYLLHSKFLFKKTKIIYNEPIVVMLRIEAGIKETVNMLTDYQNLLP